MSQQYRPLKHGEIIKKGDERKVYRPNDLDILGAVWSPVPHYMYGFKHNTVNCERRRPIPQSVKFIMEGEK